MFTNQRYLTRGVQAAISPELQFFMWSCIDRMSAPKDCLQVFRLHEVGIMQGIRHSSEQPNYSMEYHIPCENPIIEKVYVIDDGEHSTMLLASEY